VVPPPASAVSSWESIDDMIDQDPTLHAAKRATAENLSRSDVRLGAHLVAHAMRPLLYGVFTSRQKPGCRLDD
jgi:hypothetical protein